VKSRTRSGIWRVFLVVSISTLAGCGFTNSGSGQPEESDLVEACEEGIAQNNSCEELEKFNDGCDHVVDNQAAASSACLDVAFELYDCMRETSCAALWDRDGESGCWNEYFEYSDLCDGELFVDRG